MQSVENKGIFIYRVSPVLNRSWMIYLKDQQGELIPVGDYTLLDQNEDQNLSEKKLINLVSLLNESTDLIQLGEQTQSRTLFHIKPKQDDFDPTQIIFFSYNGDGVSRENAILTLEAGVA